jgi:hypothetical protein
LSCRFGIYITELVYYPEKVFKNDEMKINELRISLTDELPTSICEAVGSAEF